MLYTKRMSGYLFALLAVLQMATFYIYWQTTAHLEIKWLVYLVYWLRTLAEALVPILTAAAMLLIYAREQGNIWIFPIFPMLSRALYYLPDHYLYCIEEQLTTAEALAMAALVTFFECAALYALTLLLFMIAKKILTKNEKGSDHDFEAAPIFSLENIFVKSVFFASFAYFCLQALIEVVRTVVYLITSAGTYTIEEILTIILSFLMHFVVLLLSHAIGIFYLRDAKRRYAIPEED